MKRRGCNGSVVAKRQGTPLPPPRQVRRGVRRTAQFFHGSGTASCKPLVLHILSGTSGRCCRWQGNPHVAPGGAKKQRILLAGFSQRWNLLSGESRASPLPTNRPSHRRQPFGTSVTVSPFASTSSRQSCRLQQDIGYQSCACRAMELKSNVGAEMRRIIRGQGMIAVPP